MKSVFLVLSLLAVLYTSSVVDAGIAGMTPFDLQLPGLPGKITCNTNGTVAVCLTVPYATFAKRFAAPTILPNPLFDFSGNPLDATDSRPSCLQNPAVYGATIGDSNITPYYTGGLPVFAEDCLSLTVTFPYPVRESLWSGLKTFFYIHGGAFEVGAGIQSDARDKVINENIIVVAPNYRLGPFGFMNVRTSDNRFEAGNLGLQDQRAALKFVIPMLPAFGGSMNPNDITVAGQSAGGGSAFWQAVWQERDFFPMFSKVFLSSPYGIINTPTVGDKGNLGHTLAIDLAMQLGATPNPPPSNTYLTTAARTALETVDAATLVSLNQHGQGNGAFVWRYRPEVDGVTIIGQVEEFFRGAHPMSFWLSTLGANEATLLTFLIDDTTFDGFISAADFRAEIEFELQFRGQSYLAPIFLACLGDRAANQSAPMPSCLPPVWPGEINVGNPNFFVADLAFRGCWDINCPAKALLEILASTPNTHVYANIETAPSPYTLNSHSSNIQAIFNNDLGSTPPFSPYYQNVANNYAIYLHNFMTSGNPNVPQTTPSCSLWRQYASSTNLDDNNFFQFGAASTSATCHSAGCDVVDPATISGNYPLACYQQASDSVLQAAFSLYPLPASTIYDNL